MAYATGTYLAMAAAAAAASANAYNTHQTAKRQDAAAADSIRNQSAKQRQADARVNEEVQSLQNSTPEDSRAKRLDQYMTQLRMNKAAQAGGLTPAIGSDAFKADSASALEGVQQDAANTAGLMARMDAPGMQRQTEAAGYGRMGTDIGLLSREAKGQQFLDDLRLKSIRRNEGLDFAAGLLNAYASGGFSGLGSAAGAGKYTPMEYGGKALYRAIGPNSGGAMT